MPLPLLRGAKTLATSLVHVFVCTLNPKVSGYTLTTCSALFSRLQPCL